MLPPGARLALRYRHPGRRRAEPRMQPRVRQPPPAVRRRRPARTTAIRHPATQTSQAPSKPCRPGSRPVAGDNAARRQIATPIPHIAAANCGTAPLTTVEFRRVDVECSLQGGYRPGHAGRRSDVRRHRGRHQRWRRRSSSPATTGSIPAPVAGRRMALLTVSGGTLRTLLVQRDEARAGRYALPGGFVRDRRIPRRRGDAHPRRQGRRDRIYTEQLYTFGEPARDRAPASCRSPTSPRLARPTPGGVVTLEIKVPWEARPAGTVRVLDIAGAEIPLAFDQPIYLVWS